MAKKSKNPVIPIKESSTDKEKRFSKFFKTKLLPQEKVTEAYKKGYGAMKDNNIANKLLEMGILTHMEWIKDFDTRDSE